MSKEAIVESLKGMLATIEADTGNSSWLFHAFDTFLEDLKSLREIATIDLAKANAPKPAWHGVMGFVQEVESEVKHVVDAVKAEFTQVSGDVSQLATEAAQVPEKVNQAAETVTQVSTEVAQAAETVSTVAQEAEKVVEEVKAEVAPKSRKAKTADNNPE